MIYFDHAATTCIDKNIIPEMLRLFEENFANASSKHILGVMESDFLRESKEYVAKVFGVKPDEIYFVNSATAAANIILQGYCDLIKLTEIEKNEIIISEIEHPSVYKTAEFLKSVSLR
jgi:cysteine desulfurase